MSEDKVRYLIDGSLYSFETLKVLGIEPSTYLPVKGNHYVREIISACIGSGRVTAFTGKGGVVEYIKAIKRLGDGESLTAEMLDKHIKDISFKDTTDESG